MKLFYKLCTLFVILLIFTNPLFSQWTNLDWKMHNVGKVRQLVTNKGALDDSHDKVKTNYPGLIYCEMPPGSNEEHLFQAGIWIGAIKADGDTLVSVTRTHFTPHEFFPTAAAWDSIWVAAKNDTLDIPYWPDYTAVSDQDFVCKYSDYNILNVTDHTPLYLDVIQRSYAWSSAPLDEFIVLNYDVIPTKFDLQNVYVGFWLHGEIGNNDVADNFIDEITLFYPELQMALGMDAPGGNDGNTQSPIAIKIMEPADSSLTWTYKWYDHEHLGGYGRDPLRYRDMMTSGEVMQKRTDPEIERVHVSLCFGPIELVQVGDTLHFEIAEVFGFGLEEVMDNAEYLEFLRDRDYKVPSPPPPPPLRVTTRSHEVHISWEPQAGDINPELYQDPYRGDDCPQPFEGYRLYKSTGSALGPWTLLGEYDITNNDYNYNTGLQHEYTDIGLLNNFEYYYTITAFSKPDEATMFPSQESSKNINAQEAIPGTPSPETVGMVAVVPNPYRGDVAYHNYNPQWEKSKGTRQRWMEQDRRVQFINLPIECDIKIYTIAGDLVSSLYHNDPNKGYEDWNLTSSVGQAISSGIYLYTVEDNKNGKVQTGKFVVIK